MVSNIGMVGWESKRDRMEGRRLGLIESKEEICEKHVEVPDFYPRGSQEEVEREREYSRERERLVIKRPGTASRTPHE
jgi:hypothetical protein